MQYKLIIFDFDGTLCQTRDLVTDSIKMAYQQLGKPVPSLDVLDTTLSRGATLQNTFHLLSAGEDKSFPQQLFNKYTAIYSTLATKKTKLFPGTRELLVQLKTNHIASIILSNMSQQTLQKFVTSFKLTDYITTNIGVQEDGLCKPNPKLYDIRIAPLFPNLNPHQILMVGDTPTDLQFARAIHADACWASYGEGDSTHCRNLKPQHIIQQLNDLMTIVL